MSILIKTHDLKNKQFDNLLKTCIKNKTNVLLWQVFASYYKLIEKKAIKF